MASTEAQVRAAIMTLVKTIAGVGPVYDHTRFPITDGDYKTTVSDASGNINVAFVRLAAFTDDYDSFGHFIADLYTYEIRYFRGLDEANGSENTFNTFLMALRDALKLDANIHLLLDNGVTRGPLRTATPIAQLSELGDFKGHMAVMSLDVSVANC